MKLFNQTMRLSGIAAFAIGTFLAAPHPLVAQSAAASQSAPHVQQFTIAAKPLNQALQEFARQAGIQIFYKNDMVDAFQAKSLEGSYGLTEALDILLQGTGLVYEQTEEGTYVLKRSKATGSAHRARISQAGEQSISKQMLIEEIIVTAQKREQSIKDVPISIVALRGEDLKARQVNTYEDLGLTIPSLTVQDNGAVKRIAIRGIGNSAGAASTVGIYLDEAPLTGGLQTFQIDVPVYDVERIEVLRGPQGTLFGQGSMGGTIRFISNSPNLDSFGFGADASVAFTRHGEPSQRVQTMVNVPLVEGELGARIVGDFDHRGGWIDQPLVSKEDFNDHNINNVRVKVLWQPSDAFELSATAIAHEGDISHNMGEAKDGNFTQLLNQATTPTGSENYELYSVVATYNFGSVQLLSASSYVDTRKVLLDNSNICCGGFELYYPSQRITNESFSQELRLSSINDHSLQWTLGAFFQDADARYDAAYLFGLPLPVGDPVPASYGPFAGGLAPSSESWAAFADASLALTQRLEVGAGIRYFEDQRTFIDPGFFYNGVRVIPETQQSETFDSLSPRLYAKFDVTEDANIYASVSKGFRSGGFNIVGLPAYEPETLWSYELGTKMSFLDGRIDADIAVFYSEYADYIISGLVIVNGVPAPALTNAGELEIKGVEWTLSSRATDNLSIGLSGSYIDSEFVSVPQGSSVAVGQEGSFVPDFQATAWIDYQFELLGRGGAAYLDYSYRDRVFDADAIDQPSDVITMLNLNLDWMWSKSLSFGLFAKNLLNERGFISPGGQIYRYSARVRPTTVGVNVGVTF